MILRKTTEQFIKQSKKIHGDLYDYSKTIYKGFNENLTITCSIHGDFKQKPTSHLTKKRKCRKCSMDKVYKTRKSTAFTTKKFIEKSNKIHNSKFDYSKSIYINSFTKLIVICPKHGESQIEPRHHYKGTGCYKCGRANFSEKVKKYETKKRLLIDFKNVHEDKYDYLFIDNKFPVKTLDRVKISCKKHGVFKQLVSVHISGSGCPKCRFYGYSKKSFLEYCKKFNKNFAMVYLLKLSNEKENFYKIGITARTIRERYSRKLERGGYEYKVISKIVLTPNKVWDIEKRIKEEFSQYHYRPNNWFPGHTECFNFNLPIIEVEKMLKVKVPMGFEYKVGRNWLECH